MADDVVYDPETGHALSALGALEACLFAAPEPMGVAALGATLALTDDTVRRLLAKLRKRYDHPESGIELLEVAGGFQIRTRTLYHAFLERILEPEGEQLSSAAVEVLALVAYRQPITRPEIDQIRGVGSAHLLKRLHAEGLIRVLGRRDAPGRPKLFGTTQRFLEQFGLNDLQELPPLPGQNNEEG